MPRPLVDPDQLPEPLRAVTGALAEDPLSAEEALKDWLATGGERTPAVLVALAWACWEACLQVMVDEGAKRGPEALAWLDEAGVDGPAIRTFRAQVERGIAHAKETEAQTRRLIEAPLDATATADASRVAFALGEHGRHEEAARLYQRAAGLRKPSAQTDDLRARAALALADAGLWDEALPRLLELAEGDLGRRLPDTWPVEYAWGHLVCHAMGNTPRLLDLWRRAIARVGPGFPVMRPTQLVLLRHAVAEDIPELGRPLADRVARWPPRSRTAASREAVEAARACWP